MAAEQQNIPFMPGDVVEDEKTFRGGERIYKREAMVRNQFGQIDVRDILSGDGEKKQDWVTYDHNPGRKNDEKANAVMTLPVIEDEKDPRKAAIVLVEFKPYGKGGEGTSLEAPGAIIKASETRDDAFHRLLGDQGITFGEIVFNTGTVDEISGRAKNETATREGVVKEIKQDKKYEESGRRVVHLTDALQLVQDGKITNGLTRDLIRGAASARGIAPLPRTPIGKSA